MASLPEKKLKKDATRLLNDRHSQLPNNRFIKFIGKISCVAALYTVFTKNIFLQ